MQKFAVIGYPISHSISPRLHNLAINAFGFDAFYGRILLEDGAKLREIFENCRLNGANITIPYKENAFIICDEIDEYAKNCGSLNTIIKVGKKFYGFNTDAPGFLRAISNFGTIKNALIIGAGGTARALAYALKKSNIQVEILNRSAKRAQNFAEYPFYTWENYTLRGYDLVVNSTSAGLKDENLPLPYEILNEILSHSKYAFDVIYGRQTPFLNLAKNLDLAYKDGADMLLFQAVLAFNIFFNGNLNLEKIESAMRVAFKI